MRRYLNLMALVAIMALFSLMVAGDVNVKDSGDLVLGPNTGLDLSNVGIVGCSDDQVLTGNGTCVNQATGGSDGDGYLPDDRATSNLDINDKRIGNASSLESTVVNTDRVLVGLPNTGNQIFIPRVLEEMEARVASGRESDDYSALVNMWTLLSIGNTQDSDWEKNNLEDLGVSPKRVAEVWGYCKDSSNAWASSTGDCDVDYSVNPPRIQVNPSLNHLTINKLHGILGNNLVLDPATGYNVTIDGNLKVDGDIEKDSNSFVQSFNETHETVYTSQESPDPRAVVEGTANLEDGEVSVELPDHFTKAASDTQPEIKVQATPRSLANVAVVERSREAIKIVSDKEDVRVDYRVTAVRDGYENGKVVREKDE